uniref:Capsid protein n=1 Tax=Anisakis simplex TaxID=6269 RepID=A0A0M3IZK9_ANISI
LQQLQQGQLTTGTAARRRRNQDRTYEVTTTTESFHRTISPPATTTPFDNSFVDTNPQPNGYTRY